MNEQNVVFNLLAFLMSFVGVRLLPWRTGPGAMDGDGRIVGCDKWTIPIPTYPGKGAPVEEYEAYDLAYEAGAESFEF